MPLRAPGTARDDSSTNNFPSIGNPYAVGTRQSLDAIELLSKRLVDEGVDAAGINQHERLTPVDPRMELEHLRGNATQDDRPRDGHDRVVWCKLLVDDVVEAKEVDELLDDVQLHRSGAYMILPPPLSTFEAEASSTAVIMHGLEFGEVSACCVCTTVIHRSSRHRGSIWWRGQR